MDALLLAFLNALWQGAALIALVALALRWGLRRNATTACVVWSVAFAVVALLPAIDLFLARPAAAARNDAVVAVRIAEPVVDGHHAHANRVSAMFARAPRHAANAPALPSATALPVRRVRDAATLIGEGVTWLGGAATAFARTWGAAVLGAWALIAGILLLRLARAYAAIGAMKRDATPLDNPAVLARLRAAGHRRRAGVACSPHVAIPCAVGFRHPMIIVPAGLAASLEVDDLARVVLHESAHLQRYDDWVNALEQAVCALQFFQPALYVARRSIGFEREVACDDRVLEDAGEPLRYAECLARIVQRHVRGPRAAVVPGFVLRRAQVVARVRRIVDRSRDASPHLRAGALALGGGVLLATLGIARLQVPLVAPALALPVAAADAGAQRTRIAQRVSLHPQRARAFHTVVTARTTFVPVQATATVAAAKPSPAPRPPAVGPVVPRAAKHPVPAIPARVRAATVRAAHDGNTPMAPAAPAALAPDVAAEAAGPAGASAANVAPVAAARGAYAAASAPIARANAAVTAAGAPVAAVRAVLAQAQGQGSSWAPSARGPHRDGDLLDAIDEAKYPHPSIDELIALRNQGVSGGYLRRLAALGRGRPSLQQVLALATQGITPDYIDALDRRLAARPSFDQVVALRSQGVSASWLDSLAAIGYPKLSNDDAIALAVQGVRASYVRGLMDAGVRSLTPAQLVQLRVQGIDGLYVRRLAAHGYKNLDVDALIRLKVSGFEP